MPQPRDMHSRTRASGPRPRSHHADRRRVLSFRSGPPALRITLGRQPPKRPKIFPLRNELKNETLCEAQNRCHSRSFTLISVEDRLPVLRDIHRASPQTPEDHKVSCVRTTFLPIASTRWSHRRRIPTIRYLVCIGVCVTQSVPS